MPTYLDLKIIHKLGLKKHLSWHKEYAHMVNGRVLIDLVHTFLHVVQKIILMLPSMLTCIIVFKCIITFIGLHYVLLPDELIEMNILVFRYTQTLSYGKLVKVDKSSLGCVIRRCHICG